MTFLEQVAKYYVNKADIGAVDLADYTFVFPNKRSAMFMRKYLKEQARKIGFMPKLITITSFTQELCSLSLASNTELLFILFNSYQKVLQKKGVLTENAPDFESFIFWGNVLINDFNDVESYLVEAKQLFKNIKDVKSIEANYLTDEQIEVARILGDKRNLKSDIDNFWKHFPENPHNTFSGDKFVNLWEILYDIYIQFKQDLRAKGLSFSGMQAKIAWEECINSGIDLFRGKRFAFIGFYVLSPARLLMLTKLQEMGIAEFFWDTASALLYSQGNNASNHIRPLSRKLKMPEDFELEPIEISQDITVYPVASNIGQTKVAHAILKEWEKGKLSKGEPTTGIVMPNEKLLMPMLHSIPQEYFPINVAMRVPFNVTPFASLIENIMLMQEKARMIHGEYHFFYKDVLEILSNPYIAMSMPESVTSLKDKVKKERIYNLNAHETAEKYPELAFIFKPLQNTSDATETQAYMIGVLNGLKSIKQEKDIIEAYEKAIEQTFELTKKYNVSIKGSTYFKLIRRLLSVNNVHLNGNPVWGLQLMNLQDARALDFKDLIIMSLNEGILPAKNYRPSLIPPALRSGYHLPTREDEDITIAYQFFRLISRAKRVALIYDNRTPDLSSGEMSRFISQLELILKDKPKKIETSLGYSASEDRQISIQKSSSVLAELENFKPGGKLNFSASALKTYISCRLKFYLQYVKNLRIEDFDPEYINPASYGQVLHLVAQRFYENMRYRIKDNFITPADIENKLNSPHLTSELKKLAIDALCECYYGNKYSHNPDKIPGEGRVQARIMAEYVKRMLKCEADNKAPNSIPFIFVSGEDNGGKKVHSWQVNEKHIINFTMSIDRIDWLDKDGNYIRFIDYKTGNDDLSVPEFDRIFSDSKYGAIFQLILYCMAYADIKNIPNTPIKPLIYRFKDMAKSGIPSIKINKQEINDYRQEIIINKEKKNLGDLFRTQLSNILDEIFFSETPFSQTEDREHCSFCPFAQLCGRVDYSLAE